MKNLILIMLIISSAAAYSQTHGRGYAGPVQKGRSIAISPGGLVTGSAGVTGPVSGGLVTGSAYVGGITGSGQSGVGYQGSLTGGSGVNGPLQQGGITGKVVDGAEEGVEGIGINGKVLNGGEGITGKVVDGAEEGVEGIGINGKVLNGGDEGVTGKVHNGSFELSDCQIVDGNKIACPDGEYVKIPSTNNSLRSSIKKDEEGTTAKIKNKILKTFKAKAH